MARYLVADARQIRRRLFAVLPVTDLLEPVDALKRVLADWCPPYSGYRLFYPSRRQSSAAFALVVNALRHRG